VHQVLRKSAAGLAAVHRSGIRYGEAISWDQRKQEIPELLKRLEVAFPDILALVMHGTFNPEQVLIDGSKIGFIDFDDVCMAEPAMDVGLFCSAIKDTGLNALDISMVTAPGPLCAVRPVRRVLYLGVRVSRTHLPAAHRPLAGAGFPAQQPALLD
jgi:hypothetical protein